MVNEAYPPAEAALLRVEQAGCSGSAMVQSTKGVSQQAEPDPGEA